MDKLLTPTQVAEILQLAPKTLYNLKSTNRLPLPIVCTVGGRWRIRQSDLVAYIDNNTIQPRETIEIPRGTNMPSRRQQKALDDWSLDIKFYSRVNSWFVEKVLIELEFGPGSETARLMQRRIKL